MRVMDKEEKEIQFGGNDALDLLPTGKNLQSYGTMCLFKNLHATYLHWHLCIILIQTNEMY